MIEIKNIDVCWNRNDSDVANSCSGQVLVEDDCWFEGVVSFNGRESYVLGGLSNKEFEFMLFGDAGNSLLQFTGDRNDEGAIGECSVMHENGIYPPSGVCNFVISSSESDLSIDDLRDRMSELKKGLLDLGQIAYRKYYYHYCEGWYGVDSDSEYGISIDEEGKVLIKDENWWDYYPDGMPF